MIRVFFLLLFLLFQNKCFSEERSIVIKTKCVNLSFSLLKDFNLVNKEFEKQKCTEGYIHKTRNNAIVFVFSKTCDLCFAKSYDNRSKYIASFGTLFINKDGLVELSIKEKSDAFSQNLIFAYSNNKKGLSKLIKCLGEKNKIPFTITT